MHDEIHRDQLVEPQFWRTALDKLQITVDYDVAAIDDVPRSGPIVFVANHPFGIVDGLISYDSVRFRWPRSYRL